MNHSITIEQVLEMTKQLPLVDKVRLLERITPQINRDLRAIRKQSRKSLRGVWRGVNLSAEEINQARRALWSNFPRTDI
jgi:hypothetical protein